MLGWVGCVQCFCAAPSDDIDSLKQTSNCDIACTGDASETCGGAYAVEIYRRETAVVDPAYLGCFVDSVNDRVLTGDSSDYYPAMTIEVTKLKLAQ